MSKKKLSFYDRMDDLSDDLHGISEMLFLIEEDSIGKYDTYSMLAFLGRKLEKTRKDIRNDTTEERTHEVDRGD